jgi:CHASE3 domain sensor protein
MAWKRSRVRIPSGPPATGQHLRVSTPPLRVIQFNMRGKVQIGALALLLIAAVTTILWMVREYRRGKDAIQLSYTRSVKKRDIVDAARNALSALDDAELREQNYILTGETVYSEAYADDIRNWQDELAALELVARNDPATPLVQDFSKAGTRTLSELALILSLYDRTGRDAALDRIRKGSVIVYLDQARNNVAKIQEVDGGAFDLASQIVNKSLSSLRRLAAAAVVLFFLTVIGTVFFMLEIARRR